MLATWQRSLVVVLGTCCLLGCVLGCDEAGDAEPSPQAAASPPAIAADERWQSLHRWADVPAGRVQPTATIRADTRPTLRAHEPVTLNYALGYKVPKNGRVSLRPPLPPELQEGEVLLAIHVNEVDRWVSLPGQLVASSLERGKLRVHVDFDLPDSAGQTAGVWVQALRPLEAGDGTIDAEQAVRIPLRARLDLALGILEPAWSQGPVDFRISACGREGCESILVQRLDPARAADRGWQPHSLSLAQLAGRDVVLRFEATPLGPDGQGDGRSLPVWGDPTLLAPTVLAPPQALAPPPNMILLSLDTLRADHMSGYGYARETTPWIDRELIARGTTFERYLAAASSTRPSHMTMFTSLPPAVHGATENTDARSLPLAATTLAELLRAAGLATAAMTENGALDRSRGFGRGFGVYVENKDSQSAAMRTGHIDQTFEAGLAWLDRQRGERFFLFLHTYQVHNPFTPPADYEHFFSERSPELEPPPELRDDWSPLLYDREIRYTDDRVRWLFEELERRGHLENTIFVLTSDHGEAFLEHGFVAHGANVHHEVLHVPLIFRGPGIAADRRIASPIPMLDLMPTLLELLGVAGSGREMGESQAALVRGDAERADASSRPIYSEAWATRGYRARGMQTIDQPTFALERDGLKLVRARAKAGYRYELYDTRRDPKERRDLYPARRDAPATRALRDLLDDYESATTALREQLGAPPTETPVDPALEEKLRALGYLD